eukprot:m.49073 g.49073  ORF g.49073 m.49073 type:complete len:348 (+) comp6459_c0_seq2:2711-3754(+)
MAFWTWTRSISRRQLPLQPTSSAPRALRHTAPVPSSRTSSSSAHAPSESASTARIAWSTASCWTISRGSRLSRAISAVRTVPSTCSSAPSFSRQLPSARSAASSTLPSTRVSTWTTPTGLPSARACASLARPPPHMSPSFARFTSQPPSTASVLPTAMSRCSPSANRSRSSPCTCTKSRSAHHTLPSPRSAAILVACTCDTTRCRVPSSRSAETRASTTTTRARMRTSLCLHTQPRKTTLLQRSFFVAPLTFAAQPSARTTRFTQRRSSTTATSSTWAARTKRPVITTSDLTTSASPSWARTMLRQGCPRTVCRSWTTTRSRSRSRPRPRRRSRAAAGSERWQWPLQ